MGSSPFPFCSNMKSNSLEVRCGAIENARELVATDVASREVLCLLTVAEHYAWERAVWR